MVTRPRHNRIVHLAEKTAVGVTLEDLVGAK
jgi:hypothetical protein